MLRMKLAACCGSSEAAANRLLRGKRARGAAFAAFAVTGALGGNGGGTQRGLESATFCAVDKYAHNM